VRIGQADFLRLLEEHLALPQHPAMTDKLVEDLRLDSLAMLELWVAFEILAKRIIMPGALEGCATVADLYHFANQLLDGRSPEGAS